jgi:DME family drug/metabolite transporter
VAWGATLSLAEPLTASLLGVVVLGETLAPVQLAGGLLVAAALLALATAPDAS